MTLSLSFIRGEQPLAFAATDEIGLATAGGGSVLGHVVFFEIGRLRASGRSTSAAQHCRDRVEIDDALSVHGGFASSNQLASLVAADELPETAASGGGEHAHVAVVEAGNGSTQVPCAELRVASVESEPGVQDAGEWCDQREIDASETLSRIARR